MNRLITRTLTTQQATACLLQARIVSARTISTTATTATVTTLALSRPITQSWSKFNTRSFHNSSYKQGDSSNKNSSSSSSSSSSSEQTAQTARTIYKYVLRNPVGWTLIFLLIGIPTVSFADGVLNFVWRSANSGKLHNDVIPVRFPNLPPGTEKEAETPAEEESSSSEEAETPVEQETATDEQTPETQTLEAASETNVGDVQDGSMEHTPAHDSASERAILASEVNAPHDNSPVTDQHAPAPTQDKSE